MVLSEQRKEIGDRLFTQLQDEVCSSDREKLDGFLSDIRPDDMGFIGKEGTDED